MKFQCNTPFFRSPLLFTTDRCRCPWSGGISLFRYFLRRISSSRLDYGGIDYEGFIVGRLGYYWLWFLQTLLFGMVYKKGLDLKVFNFEPKKGLDNTSSQCIRILAPHSSYLGQSFSSGTPVNKMIQKLYTLWVSGSSPAQS